ncbi:DUF2167 domain-containing protein [Sphingomonas sp. MM-1]|uniref:DUF2167 domain-containing protein n=1 Tax=Sphingomonas sp. MM-1 TaxID=745310 RepID=UPI0005A4A38F|nr:DUF2167 domain-containing protein [Sphingomonas sp. MM-1]
MRIKMLAAAILLAGVPAQILASPAANTTATAELTAEQKAYVARMKALLDSLHPRTGDVPIGNANATLHLGEDYYFLPAEEAKKVLVEGWGNPPDAVGGVLGLVFPKGKTFLDDSWGAVVTYEATGYVSDKDAKTEDYDALLRDIQESEKADNEERTKAGYAARHLVGWAQQPSYDPADHSLIWARDIRFSGSDVDALNYDVRLLGRHGVLSLNMVASMPQLAEVRTAAAAFGKAASFDVGSRYADYDSSKDKTAEFGLAGLVAAGAGVAAAKKVGLLGAVLLFGKKFLAIFIAAIAGGLAWVRRKFSRSGEEG